VVKRRCRKVAVIRANIEQRNQVAGKRRGAITYVRNVRGWLYGALRYRCVDYLRVRGREIPLEPEHDPADERPEMARDSMVRELTFAAVLSHLGEKCRVTLRGYYLGDNQRDLAEKLSTTPGYVDQLISTCRRRAAEVFRSLGLRRR